MTSIPSPRTGDEFPPGASEWPADLDRREFLRLGASVFAAAGLGGCSRPDQALMPYVLMPEQVVPGVPLYYASAALRFGYARGILVETHEGRPTKIEGNPSHAESGGATDAVTQASVLTVYDPDRSQAPSRSGVIAPWTDFEAYWIDRRGRLVENRGRGWALLTEPTSSPAMLAGLGRLLDRFPEARWYQHTALARYDEGGVQEDDDPAKADVMLTIESDFLMDHPAAIRYSRGYAARRRVVDGRLDSSRIYTLESGWTATGALADARLPAPPSRFPRVLRAIAAAVGGGGTGDGLSGAERVFAAGAAADLRRRAPNVLCVAGAEQPAAIRRWAWAMNRRLGAVGRTTRFLQAVRSDGDRRCAGDLAALCEAIDRREVDTLCLLGVNPVYTAPGELEFERRLRSVPYTVHAGEHDDETGAACLWHLPESDNLEAWGDARGYDGSALLRQPMIEPMYPSRSLIEMLRWFSDAADVPGFELVRDRWRRAAGADGFDDHWRRWLNRGVIDPAVPGASGKPAAPPATGERDLQPADAPDSGGIELVFRSEPFLGDGRVANNPWLQEAPRPFTAMVWDTALWLGPESAGRLGVAHGDVVRIEASGRSTEAAVTVLPGQADGCAIAFLGGGRRRAGAAGNGRGYNPYIVRSRGSPWLAPARLVPTGRTYPLVSTQGEFSQHERDQARFLPVAELPRAVPEAGAPRDSLYGPWPRGTHAWAMLIDLSTCVGCSACVVACQAENNIPSVGKDQAARGRAMHWIRVDRHYQATDRPVRVISQPVPCMHCEDAPCELVCPVGATVHSSEGLNEMIYNRCVGTRYCSNNCPYKVRRFNFFDYRAPKDSPLHLQDNPNVTVRQRGVMEKCSYCVQRIEEARIAAERANRPIRDGEIKTACQQVCPTEAIVFGDQNDPNSLVSRRKRERTHYALLGELNTRPRTTYLARMVNPPPPASG